MRDDKPKAQPTPPPSEAELSRIAREAVHQPADARLDRQLIRMGVIDADEPPVPVPTQPASVAPAVDQAVIVLQAEIRRTKRLVWLLVGVVVILAIVIIGLLVR